MKFRLAPLMLVLASSAAIAIAPASADPVQPEAAPPAAESAAPSAERMELARQFIALSSPAEMMMEGLRTGFWNGAADQLADMDDEQIEAIEARAEQFLARLEPKFKQLMPGLLEAYAQVYAREFSAEELRDMVAFATSPTGKHYLSRYGFLEMDPRLTVAQQELMSGLAPEMQEFAKELCTERANERLAAGDTKASCPLAKDSETHSG